MAIIGTKFLKYGELTVGELQITVDRVMTYTPRTSEDGYPIDNSCPLGMYPVVQNNLGFEPDIYYQPGTEDILFWLSDRVFPENRQNRQYYLGMLGLVEYDVLSIIEKTHGFSFNDFYWIANDELEERPDINNINLFVTDDH
ncbi:hypothetical protein ABGV42_01335 [Paenibacillus pabuli]|uniref:hypothetical protein n=1 Tax=Paenibacillus pabuli TaxID=1472 RepID=UPI00324286B6